ncbi:hypothetical protein V8U11_07955 [Pseudomonas chlororaphis]|uniref:hypothetical protein n=1 Tax=Pseudomonas chlororaphis TaxID=587753 RepID=UPI0030D03A05
MRHGWMRLRWLFNRRTAWTLMWTVAVLAAAVAANLVGIHMFGSLAGWQRWLDESSVYFLVWRLLVYGVTAGLWLRMRSQLLAREAEPLSRKRLLRAEIAGVLALIVLEASVLTAN